VQRPFFAQELLSVSRDPCPDRVGPGSEHVERMSLVPSAHGSAVAKLLAVP